MPWDVVLTKSSHFFNSLFAVTLGDFKDAGTKLLLEIMNALARAIDYSNSFHAFVQQRANDRLCSSSCPNNYCGLVLSREKRDGNDEGRR